MAIGRSNCCVNRKLNEFNKNKTGSMKSYRITLKFDERESCFLFRDDCEFQNAERQSITFEHPAQS